MFFYPFRRVLTLFRHLFSPIFTFLTLRLVQVKQRFSCFILLPSSFPLCFCHLQFHLSIQLLLICTLIGLMIEHTTTGKWKQNTSQEAALHRNQQHLRPRSWCPQGRSNLLQCVNHSNKEISLYLNVCVLLFCYFQIPFHCRKSVSFLLKWNFHSDVTEQPLSGIPLAGSLQKIRRESPPSEF